MPEALASCRVLDWDSEFFGFPVARVRESTIDEALAHAIDRCCVEAGIRCLYFLADAEDRESTRVAAAYGYRPVDVRLSLRHDLADVSADFRGIRDSRLDDIPALTALAARSHHDSRFYHDSGFSRERCDALYATWIENGIRDPDRLVLVAEVEGVAVGYQLITPATDGGVARMEILAVDEAHRGMGLGRSLLSAGLHRALSDGASAVDTATQERNARSLEVHLAIGFSRLGRQVWHHKWYSR